MQSRILPGYESKLPYCFLVLQIPLMYRMATDLDQKDPHAEKRSRYLWKVRHASSSAAAVVAVLHAGVQLL
jgi:hypothetical protein